MNVSGADAVSITVDRDRLGVGSGARASPRIDMKGTSGSPPQDFPVSTAPAALGKLPSWRHHQEGHPEADTGIRAVVLGEHPRFFGEDA